MLFSDAAFIHLAVCRPCLLRQRPRLLPHPTEIDLWGRCLRLLACDTQATLQAMLPIQCGTHCVVHPSTKRVDHGWIYQEFHQCWWYTTQLASHPICKKHLVSMFEAKVNWPDNKLPVLSPQPMFQRNSQYTTAAGHSKVAPARASSKHCDEVAPGICGPHIIIIGAMMCGPRAVSDWLLRHPRVKVNLCSSPTGMAGDARGLSEKEMKRNAFLGAVVDENCLEEEGMYQGELAHKMEGGRVINWDQHPFTFDRHNKKMAHNDHRFLRQYADRLPSTDGLANMTFDVSPSYFDTVLWSV